MRGLTDAGRSGPRAFKVLVIEDDPYTRYVMVELLKDEPDLSVQGASTGAEAIDLVQQARPDAIVMDLHLPDGTGFDLWARLRSDPDTQGIPAIAMSALGLQALDAARAAGFTAVVDKPFDAEQFLETVRRVLAGVG